MKFNSRIVSVKFVRRPISRRTLAVSILLGAGLGLLFAMTCQSASARRYTTQDRANDCYRRGQEFCSNVPGGTSASD